MILLTGGLGMIGAHTARALVDLGEQVVITAHRATDIPSFLVDRVAVERVDLTDRESVLRLGDRHEIRDIVHLAGSVPTGPTLPFFRHDLGALLTMLEAARAWGVRRFAVASSVSVYSGRTESALTEDLPLPSVRSPHAIVAFKKAVEPLVQYELDGSDVSPVILRIGSTWGPLMDPESPFNPVPRTVGALLRGEAVDVQEPGDGDVGYAPDIGRAIALLAAARHLSHHTYNVASGTRFIGNELAEALREGFPDGHIRFTGGDPDNGPRMDLSRLVADTGFRAQFDIRSAVADYVAWRSRNRR